MPLAGARISVDSNGLVESFPPESITTYAAASNGDFEGFRSLAEGGQLTLPQYLAESGLQDNQYQIANTLEHTNSGMRTHYVDLVHNGQRVYNSRMVITTDSSDNVVSGDRLNTMKTWKPQSGMCGVPSRSAEIEPDINQLTQTLTNFLTVEESGENGDNMGLRDSTNSSWSADTIQFAGYVYFAIDVYTIIEGMQWVSTVGDSVLDIITDRRGEKLWQMDNLAKSVGSSQGYGYNVMSPQMRGDITTNIMQGPVNPKASPYGWHSKPSATMGNNVILVDPRNGNATISIQPNAKGIFDYPVDVTKQPQQYQQATAVNVFFWVNHFHDVMYQYGFDVNAGNFQESDPNGGKGTGDPIVVNIQKTDKFNNANFVTHVDGKKSVLNLYLWNKNTPYRDGGLCVDIVIHEVTHGVTSRLVGGPDVTGCLSSSISSGVAEGWSDIVALIFKIGVQNNRNQEYGIGEWASNSKSVRKYTYTSNEKVNPLKFGDLAKAENQKPHTIGLVWATILYEVMWNFNDMLGISDNLFESAGRTGNTLFLRTLVEGWQKQSCNPTIFNARDRFLQVLKYQRLDQEYCAAWDGFAKRGMGVSAVQQYGNRYENHYDVPQECKRRQR
ncbi:hypothetical protein IWQ62_001054 [Dispira parvispora]|uniref:Extracellular metalloproteinase n=1 Tax=Dispira parvispora TaxID=1520584 RepID=A0A9W8AVW4_9FUNG|nr:hypothetical protein IWQ62_001054 [Dispira parvispora]